MATEETEYEIPSITVSQIHDVSVKAGFLWKTSNIAGRTVSKSQYFVLTKSSLDQYKSRLCDKLKGRVLLAAIESVEVIEKDGLFRAMRITCPCKHPLELTAPSKAECDEWVNAIRHGTRQWRLDSEDIDDGTLNSDVCDGITQPNVELLDVPDITHMKRSSLTPSDISIGDAVVFTATNQIHQEYSMIKYARTGKAIPHERVFKLDNDDLHIMWKKRGKTYSFCYRNTLSIDNVVEVRCGQQTRNFVKFPYTEVENQSFSVIFEKEQGEWANLLSLDLICDTPKAFERWREALQELIYEENTRINRRKHGPVDPVILWLKCHWSVLRSQHSRITIDQALTFAHQSSPQASRRQLKHMILKDILETQSGVLHKSDERILWNSFLLMFNTLNGQPRVHDIYKRYAKISPDVGMTLAEFAEFLTKEQKEPLSMSACAKLISFHDKWHRMYKRKCAGNDLGVYRQSKQLLSYHGFLSFIRSMDNAITKPEHTKVYQDMDLPLTDYYINSSHNTYLMGHQLKGQSSLEAYTRALLIGCRCLELDCWDGPDEPIITHGLTLTSKIRFRDVVQVIREYAFETSEYPVILSLENHCSEQQQAIMADIFVRELGDMLVTDDISEEITQNKLPSPNDLKRKIILKGKIKQKKKVKGKYGSPFYGNSTSTKRKSSKGIVHSQSETHLPLIRKSSDQPLIHHKLSSVSNMSVTDSINSSQTQLNSTTEDLNNVVPLSMDMDRLIVYCRAVAYKKNEISDDCCEMYSLNESNITDLITAQSRDILNLSSKHMVRTYPKASRVDSSNYDPQVMWNAGVQMVALNFQKPDAGMHLNQGLFRKNGGCGYILKPEVIRNRDQSFYHPRIKNTPKGGKSCYFTIEILSGQYLHNASNCKGSLSVEVETKGVPIDSSSFCSETTYERLNPHWYNCKHMFQIIMPELCLIYFKVQLHQRKKSKLFFQNVIPLDSIRPGLRYIPLRTITGVPMVHSGLFVRIKIQEFEPASDRVKGTSRERLLTF